MTRQLQLPGRIGRLARAIGTEKALAAKLGVATVQVWRWAHKLASPNLRNRKRINALARKHGIADLYKVAS